MLVKALDIETLQESNILEARINVLVAQISSIIINFDTVLRTNFKVWGIDVHFIYSTVY